MRKNHEKSKSTVTPPSSLQRGENQQSGDSNKKKPAEIYSEKELNFSKFIRSDLSRFSAKITGVRQKVISSTEYVIEIQISQIPYPIKRYKTYNQFRAFYKALKLRFVNVKWPEFPSRIQIIKKIETRMQAFNQILDKIFETIQVGSTYKKSLLSIFYAFFLEGVDGSDYEREDRKTLATQKSGESHASDQDESFTEEVLRNSILDFEKRHREDLAAEEMSFVDEAGIADLKTQKIASSDLKAFDVKPFTNDKEEEKVAEKGINDKDSPNHKIKVERKESAKGDAVPFEIKAGEFGLNSIQLDDFESRNRSKATVSPFVKQEDNEAKRTPNRKSETKAPQNAFAFNGINRKTSADVDEPLKSPGDLARPKINPVIQEEALQELSPKANAVSPKAVNDDKNKLNKFKKMLGKDKDKDAFSGFM